MITGWEWRGGRQAASLLGLRAVNGQEADQSGEVSHCVRGSGGLHALIELIEPHYPKASKRGGPSTYQKSMMLRVHLLLNC
jgi:hypothetical protein